jgi:hypothetical protein
MIEFLRTTTEGRRRTERGWMRLGSTAEGLAEGGVVFELGEVVGG